MGFRVKIRVMGRVWARVRDRTRARARATSRSRTRARDRFRFRESKKPSVLLGWICPLPPVQCFCGCQGTA